MRAQGGGAQLDGELSRNYQDGCRGPQRTGIMLHPLVNNSASLVSRMLLHTRRPYRTLLTVSDLGCEGPPELSSILEAGSLGLVQKRGSRGGSSCSERGRAGQGMGAGAHGADSEARNPGAAPPTRSGQGRAKGEFTDPEQMGSRPISVTLQVAPPLPSAPGKVWSKLYGRQSGGRSRSRATQCKDRATLSMSPFASHPHVEEVALRRAPALLVDGRQQKVLQQALAKAQQHATAATVLAEDVEVVVDGAEAAEGGACRLA